MKEPRFVMTVHSSKDYGWTSYEFKLIWSPERSVAGEHDAYMLACHWARDNIPLRHLREGNTVLSLSIDTLEYATMFRLRWC